VLWSHTRVKAGVAKLTKFPHPKSPVVCLENLRPSTPRGLLPTMICLTLTLFSSNLFRHAKYLQWLQTPDPVARFELRHNRPGKALMVEMTESTVSS